MSATNLDFRIVILTTGSAWTPGSSLTSKEIWFSTLPGSNCYINSNNDDAVVDADGQAVDVMEGTYEVGAYTVEVVDANTATNVNQFTQYLTDSLARMQLLTLQAFVQRSTNGGTSWTTELSGYITSIKKNGMVYSINIGETTNLEKNFLPFSNIQPDAPYRGYSCFMGGPIKIADIQNITSNTSYFFGPQQDFGPIQTKVIAKDTTRWFDDVGNPIYAITVQPHNGWYLQNNGLWYNQDSMHKDRSDWIRKLIHPSLVQFKTKVVVSGTPKGAPVGYYSGVEVEAYNKTTKKLQHVPLLTQDPSIQSGPFNPISTTQSPNQNGITFQWTGSSAGTPSIGDDVLIYAYFTTVSDTNPLHIQANPVDIITNYWTYANINYDATAAANVRALYSSFVLQLYLTDPSQTLQDFLTPIFALFGINFFIDDNGNRSLFSTIINTGTMPVTTITPNNIVDDGSAVFFEMEEGTIVNKITADQMVFYAWDPSGDNSQMPVDGLVVAKQTHSFIAPQLGTYGVQEKTFSLPGHLVEVELYATNGGLPGVPQYLATRYVDGNWDAFVNSFGYEMCQRFLRGAIYTELNLIGVTGSLGNEYVLTLPQMLPVPQIGNTPVTQLNGSACVQMIQKTKTALGMKCKFLSSGLNAQPLTSPQFTLRANPIDPRRSVDALITNSASLNSNGYDVAVQYTFGNVTSTAGNQYVLQNNSVATFIPATSSISAPYGSTVNVRMQSRDPGNNKRPGVWTAWQSLKTTDILPPNTITTSGSTQNLLLKFHPGEADLPTEVWVYPNGQVLASASLQLVLPPSSSQTFLQLNPTTGYTASLRHVMPAPGFATSSWASLAISSSIVSQYQLPAPDNPRAYVGQLDTTTGNVGTVDGTYGLQVHATAIPSNCTLEEAVETASGSGVYGAFTQSVNVVSSLSGFTTIPQTTAAANDGRRRQLRSRSVRVGVTASLYTPPVTISPWIAQNPTDYPVPCPSDFGLGTVVQGDPRALSSFVVASYTKPTASQFDHMQYKVRSKRNGDTTGFSAYATVNGNAIGPDLLPAQPNTIVGVIPVTVTSGGVLSASFESFVTMSNYVLAEPAFTITSSSVAINFAWTYDLTTNYMEAWSQEYTANPGTVATVENIGTYVQKFYVNDGRTSYSLPLVYSNDYRVTTFIPFDVHGKRGTPVTFKAQGVIQASSASGSGAATGSSGGTGTIGAPGATTNTSVDTLTIVNNVAIGSGLAGWFLNSTVSPAPADGAYTTSGNGTVTSTDITNGHKTVTFGSLGYTPGQMVTCTSWYTSASVNSPNGAPLTVTIPGSTLSTPSVVADDYDQSAGGFNVYITPGANTPTGTTFKIEGGFSNPPSGIQDTTTSHTGFVSVAQTSGIQTYFVRCFASKTGYTDSGQSSVQTVTIPRAGSPL